MLRSKPFRDRELGARRWTAAGCGTAARGGIGGLALALSLLQPLACSLLGPDSQAPPEVPAVSVHAADPPSTDERYCAWYGEADQGVLYFGQAAFWSSYRAAGKDPRADLARPGPRPIGRFDLRTRTLLEPFETGPRPGGGETFSGVWDVLPQAGRVYFTTYFEEAGFVELETGEVTLLPDGRFWNEIASGPLARHEHGFGSTAEKLLLVSRYADASHGGGAVLVVDPRGRVLRELTIGAAEPGVAYAAKTPAWDPVGRYVWVTTDRLPLPEDELGPFPHPTFVLDLEGNEVARFGYAIDPAEIQFVRFTSLGMGFFAIRKGTRLELVMLPPTADRLRLEAAPTVVLDDAFPVGLDFTQDIQIGPDGSAFVTRWSGRVYQVHPRKGLVESWALPRDGGELYYTGVSARSGGAVCATRCGDVEVVCASPPIAGTR